MTSGFGNLNSNEHKPFKEFEGSWVRVTIPQLGTIYGQLEEIRHEDSTMRLNPFLSPVYYSKDLARTEIVTRPVVLSYFGQPICMNPIEKSEVENYAMECERDFHAGFIQREKAIAEILGRNNQKQLEFNFSKPHK